MTCVVLELRTACLVWSVSGLSFAELDPVFFSDTIAIFDSLFAIHFLLRFPHFVQTWKSSKPCSIPLLAAASHRDSWIPYRPRERALAKTTTRAKRFKSNRIANERYANFAPQALRTRAQDQPVHDPVLSFELRVSLICRVNHSRVWKWDFSTIEQ